MVTTGSVRAVVVAIHGILTRTTIPSWPDYLDAFLSDCKVERRDYVAFPDPMVNVFIKNRIHANALAEELELVADRHPLLPLHFVGHSNGCDIVLKTVKILAKRGVSIGSIILTGSVTDPDVKKSGVASLIITGKVRRAFAYCSNTDEALALPFKWPYKELGRRGWMLDGKPYNGAGLITRRFDGYGHGDYFAPGHRDATFAQMRADMNL